MHLDFLYVHFLCICQLLCNFDTYEVIGNNDYGIIKEEVAMVKLKWTLFFVLFMSFPTAMVCQREAVEKVVDIIKHRSQYPQYTLVSAHRGYWADYPENSTKAYEMAMLIGADIVEMDVRLTKDDVMVVFHDACLDRVTTGYGRLREENFGYVSSLFLKYEDGTASPYKVLTLSDALDFLKDKAVVAVDIKEGGKLFETTMVRVLKMLKQKGMLWQSIVKGKMRLNDLKIRILDKAEVTFDDFIYTPIAFSTTQT